MAETPKGPFILWVYYGSDGWSFRDHETFEAAINDVANWGASAWTITQGPVVIDWSPHSPKEPA